MKNDERILPENCNAAGKRMQSEVNRVLKSLPRDTTAAIHKAERLAREFAIDFCDPRGNLLWKKYPVRGFVEFSSSPASGP